MRSDDWCLLVCDFEDDAELVVVVVREDIVIIVVISHKRFSLIFWGRSLRQNLRQKFEGQNKPEKRAKQSHKFSRVHARQTTTTTIVFVATFYRHK